MKKMTIPIVMGLLCLYISAIAQKNEATDLTAQGIQIGQRVPDISITNIQNYKSASARISDFRGKLLILDFWATWCSPCVAMIPRMDSLQKEFGDKVQFLSVTYQKDSEVLPFLEKFEKQRRRHFSIPTITGDTALHKLFPHLYLPHYVWIDGNGIVKAITEYKDVNAANISKVLNAEAALTEKKDVRTAYDNNKPFLINGNGGDGSGLIYHSVFTAYTDGLPPGYAYTPVKPAQSRRITATNQTMLQLIRLAYGADQRFYGWNRLLLETRDAAQLRSGSKGQAYLDWLKGGNAYCYELVVPPYLSKEAFSIMRKDIESLFPNYTVSGEKKRVKCLVLKRTSDTDKIRSTGGEATAKFNGMGFQMRNCSLDILPMRLEVLYLQKYPHPIVNGTGYAGNVDLEINATMSNVEDLNKALGAYDLRFEQEDWETDVLIVRNVH